MVPLLLSPRDYPRGPLPLASPSGARPDNPQSRRATQPRDVRREKPEVNPEWRTHTHEAGRGRTRRGVHPRYLHLKRRATLIHAKTTVHEPTKSRKHPILTHCDRNANELRMNCAGRSASVSFDAHFFQSPLQNRVARLKLIRSALHHHLRLDTHTLHLPTFRRQVFPS